MPDSTTTSLRDELTPREMLAAIEDASQTVDREYCDQLLTCSEGEVPQDLAGVLYRNGPGRLERGGVRYQHPFDGDGHIVRLAFERGYVRYTNRFVRTRPFVEEEAAGRMLYRGFGTNLPGGLRANLLRMQIKNTANTNIVYHGGKLLALWEAGLPHRLDPITLEALGTEDYAGRLRNPFSPIERALAPDMPFSADPCLEEDTGELFNFGVLFGMQHRLMLYRVSPEGEMAPPQMHALPRFSFIHDFQLTRRYLVFLIPDADFNVPRTLLGLATPAGSLRLRPDRPLRVLLIPRDGGPAMTFETGKGFAFHIAHGYDRDDGCVVLDVCRYREYPAFDRLEALFAPDGPAGIAHLERILVDPQSGRCESFPLSPRPAELPRVTVAYASGQFLPTATIRGRKVERPRQTALGAKLPVNPLKIDRSLVATRGVTPERMTIATTIISLAHPLGLRVIRRRSGSGQPGPCSATAQVQRAARLPVQQTAATGAGPVSRGLAYLTPRLEHSLTPSPAHRIPARHCPSTRLRPRSLAR